MSVRMRSALAAIVWAGPAVLAAAELKVPSPFATIQQAVTAAVDGDHVVVAPGTYHEAIDLLGKKITLRSSDGAEKTILSGERLQQSIVIARSGETLATVVQGFTFANGRGSFTSLCDLAGFLGGAILTRDSGLTVRDSLFEGSGVRPSGTEDSRIASGEAIFACRSDLTVSGSHFRHLHADYGGAIFAGGASPRVTIAGSTFTDNASAHGGAVFINLQGAASAAISNCRFERNEATHGGGLRYSGIETTAATIRDTTFSGNAAAFGGGANIRASEFGTIEVSGCDFSSNKAGFGGGVFAVAERRTTAQPGGTIGITRTRFLDNVIEQCCDVGIYADGCFRDGRLPEASGLFYGGGADVRTIGDGTITIASSLFAGNSAARGGGAHTSSCGGGTIEFLNTTIVDNEGSGIDLRMAVTDSPGFRVGGNARITNSIVYGNSGESQIPVAIDGVRPTVTVSHSIVQGGFGGANNIDSAPAFVDALARDYRLAPGSAGIDAGDNTAVAALAADLAGEPRFIDDPATCDAGQGEAPVVDIGAFEFKPSSRSSRRRAIGNPADCNP